MLRCMETIDETAEFLETLVTISEHLTACRGRTAHELIAHLATARNSLIS
jgi:hypothetical protein